ncbi:hypothetical protein NXH67_16210 [Butyrivibrio sp. DSM 10294]|uniref:hypothetical protein n=1 Tax=Butyrivibrio sp. DSM 10294 TaxID=2972457 RepID=UPI00234F4665|nr:hypothetical protein [Butyrivibrio sp. DSM 10294]MDC7295056.1 hypothetical protein [Butyrivibrio sp. DSM 10294]
MNNAFKPQSIEEIENRIERLAKSYTPEWRFNRYNPDAGSVIAQIFARQLEENNRLMSQMPERYHMEFVNMLDSNLRPAQPAASMVIFNLDGNSIMGTQVPKGTRLTADSPYTDSGFVIYETERNLYVTESRIKCAFMTDAEKGSLTPIYGDIAVPQIIPTQDIIMEKDLTEEPQEGESQSTHTLEPLDESFKIKPFTLFGEKQNVGKSVLIIYHDRLLEGVNEPIYVRLEGAKALIERIEKKEFLFKYPEKKSFTEFDSVKLLEDGMTYELIKSKPSNKVRVGGTEMSAVILECQEIMTDYLEIENIQISAAGDSRAPEYVGDGAVELNSEKFEPFSDTLSVYNECYIGHNPCFSKREARVFLDFRVSFKENHIRLTPEQEDAELAIIKLKPKKTPLDAQAAAVVDEISIEYFNGIGWKKLKCDSEYEGLFVNCEDGNYKLSFICPSDWEESESGPYSGRCLRMRITKSDNCYLRPALHTYPTIEKLKITYSYEGKFVSPSKLEKIAGTTKEDITYALTSNKPFTAFSGIDYHEDALFIGLDKKLTDGPISIYFQLADSSNQNAVRCNLEYYSPTGFAQMRFTDLTEDFTRSGTLMFLPPSDMQECSLEGNNLYWIKLKRSRAQKSDFSDIFLPHIVRLCLNAVIVTNVQTSDENDYYIEEVMPNMTVALGAQNILDAYVWVNERGYTRKEEMDRLMAQEPERVRAEYDFLGRISAFYVLWNEVESFDDAVDRRSYRIDRMRGNIVFSDGAKCDIPRVTDDIAFKARIRSTDGEYGNLAEGMITDLVGAAPFIDSVSNPIRAHGGSNLETMDHALMRCAGIMNSRWRLVSENDYIRFVMEYSDSIDKVKVVVGETIDGVVNPSDISVVLLMKDFADGAFSYHRIAGGLKKEILKNCELTVTEENLHIVEPIFVDISVNVWAMVMDMDDSFEVQNEAKNVLAEYLNPVSSPEHEGWAIGTLPKQSQILMRLGVLRSRAVIQRITITARYVDCEGEHEVDAKDIKLTPFMVTRSGNHKVIVTNK